LCGSIPRIAQIDVANPTVAHSGDSAVAYRVQPWEETRKRDSTPVHIVTYVSQAQKRSVGRTVRQPAPESGGADRVSPTPCLKIA